MSINEFPNTAAHVWFFFSFILIPQTIGKGSGIFGSIKASDLEGFSGGVTTTVAAASGLSSSSYSDSPISNIRNVIAKRLIQSKQVIGKYLLFFLTSSIQSSITDGI